MRECGVTIKEILAMPVRDRNITYDCLIRANNVEYGNTLHSRYNSGDKLSPEEIMDYEVYYTEETERRREYNNKAKERQQVFK